MSHLKEITKNVDYAESILCFLLASVDADLPSQVRHALIAQALDATQAVQEKLSE